MKYFIILTLFAHTAAAQPEGFIVRNNGDTLRGHLTYDYKHRQVRFTGDATVYALPDMKSFYTGNRYYERFPIRMRYPGAKDIHRLQPVCYRKLVTDSAFFEKIVDGPVLQLFHYPDAATGISYFIIRPANQPAFQLNYCDCMDPTHISTEDHYKFREPLLLIALEHNLGADRIRIIQSGSVGDLREIVKMINRQPSRYDRQLKIPKNSVEVSAIVIGQIGRTVAHPKYAPDVTHRGSVVQYGIGLAFSPTLKKGRVISVVRANFQYLEQRYKIFTLRQMIGNFNVLAKFGLSDRAAIAISGGIGLLLEDARMHASVEELLDTGLNARDKADLLGGALISAVFSYEQWEIGFGGSILRKLDRETCQRPQVFTLQLGYRLFRKKFSPDN